MDSSENRLIPDLERALRKAYDRPLGAQSGDDAQPRAATADEPALPERIGRYLVRGVIARGGMGSVLRALDPELGREVAVKVSRSLDPALLRLFAAEARICSQLQHPGIVPIYERGTTDDGRPYYVMKLIDGETFSTLLGARTSPTADTAKMLEIFMAVCQTLAYVHARGVFHGDLKPANIMVGAFGEVQVMDWGVAGSANAEDSDDGRPADGTPLAMGTPAYMPPERARGERGGNGVRSDVFSLGAILCEILTGEPPYRGADRREILLKAVNGWLDEALTDLRSARADDALVRLACSCLALNPADRPADAEVVAKGLSEHMNAVGLRARAAEVELARAHVRHAAGRRTQRLTLALAAAVIFGIIGGGTGFVLFSEEKRNRQADAGRLVDEAMVEAHHELAQAGAQEPPTPEAWAKAQTAAARAVALADRPPVDAATRDRAHALLAETRVLMSDRLRYLGLQDRIEEIEHHALEENRSADWLDAAYRDAFREIGFNPADIETQLHADVRTRALLGLALSRWALQRRQASANPSAGEDLLRAAMLVDPDPARKDLCAAFLAGDRDGLREAGRAIEKLGAAPESMLLVAHFLAALNHPDEAVEVLRSACLRHPADFRVHHELAARLGAHRNAPLEEIVRLLSVCTAVRPSSAHAFTDLGIAYYSREDLGRAIDHLRRATAMTPSHTRGWAALSCALFAAGEPEAATDAARQYLRFETDGQLLAQNAAQWNTRGAFEIAELGLRKAVEAAPDLASAREDLGRFEADRGSCDAAVVQLREAVRLAPRSVGAWQSLGRVLRRKMDLDEACEALKKAADLDGGSIEMLSELAPALMVSGRVDEALQTLEDAVDRSAVRDSAESRQRAASVLKAARRAADLLSPEDALRRSSDAAASGAAVAVAAQGAYLRGWYAASAALFRDAFAKDPSIEGVLREEGARSASLAGRGFGGDAGSTDSAARRALRDRALSWLTDELDALSERADARHLDTPEVARRLVGWNASALFPSPRGAAEFDALPDDERQKWTAFWAGVDRVQSDLRRLVMPPGVVRAKTFSASSLGITGPLAGMEFAPDGERLYVVSNAGFEGAVVEMLPVRRDPSTRAVVGFGPATVHAAAGHADGGLSFGPKGTFFWSTWRKHEIGQRTVDGNVKRFPLNGSGVPAGGGGLVFGPRGHPSEGALLLSSYADGGIYRVQLTDNADGTFTPVPGSAALVARCPRGCEGIRFVPSGRWAGGLLVCNWDAGAVSLVAVDPTTGLPVVGKDGLAECGNFLRGVAGAAGLAFDPVSGDLLVSAWGSGNAIHVFSGVAR